MKASRTALRLAVLSATDSETAKEISSETSKGSRLAVLSATHSETAKSASSSEPPKESAKAIAWGRGLGSGCFRAAGTRLVASSWA